MQYQVLVQNRDNNGYVAEVIGVSGCAAEGKSEEEAIAKATAALQARLRQGKIVVVEVNGTQTGEHPLLKHAGRFKDDPTFDAVMADIEKYRCELDAAEKARDALASGAGEKPATLARPLTGNPWLDSAGIFQDDPTYDDFLANIAAYREEVEVQES